MKILITGASSRLGRALASELGQDHHLRLMDSTAVELPGSGEFFKGAALTKLIGNSMLTLSASLSKVGCALMFTSI